MMDQSDKGSQPETMNSEGIPAEEEDQKKSCADCGTTKTPLWRGGPAGPKSLCNACGIRSRKKRRALLSLKHGGGTEEKKTKKSSKKSSSKFGDSIERRVWDLGREVVLQRSSLEKQRKKQLGEEEEQAAVLLMSLSYGSVYA